MSGIRRLVYVTLGRLPTEKAHGYQIGKMCEAFARSGVEVVLLHPYRRQADRQMSHSTVFEYYGMNPVFAVRPLPNLEILPLEPFIPGGAFVGLSFVHAVAWGWFAARTARRHRADIYFTRQPEVAFSLARLGLPAVFEAHAVPGSGQRLLLRYALNCGSLRLAIATTSFIRDALLAIGVPAEKTAVLPNGVDLSLFEGLPGKEECRRRLGLPMSRPIVGYVGRFQTLGEEKGIPDLVRAMAHLPSFNGSDPLLLCVGGPMHAVPGYLDLARRHGIPTHRLQFVDRVPASQVPYWIRACDVATVPLPWTQSYAYSSCSMKVFEYMAAQVPIVATRLPAIEEVLRHGQTAWLAEPGNARSLGEGITRLLGDPGMAGRMTQRSHQEILQHTWERRAGSILRSLAEEGAKTESYGFASMASRDAGK